MDTSSNRLYNVLTGNVGNTNSYNAIGRTAGKTKNNDNFFTKRGKSIENAIDTTVASVIGAVDIANENKNIDDRLNRQRKSLDDIAKKYGYDSFNGVWDARDAAEKAGDTELVNKIDTTVVPELKAQTAANSEESRKAAKNWEDYRKNSYVGQKINQDPGKFAGSAINTLSTATDILGLTNGPISNAIQGGIEGVADELEENGLNNFSWERARQNALTGAASGAAVGALNNGVNNMLAKNGGNLFKGGNRLTQGLNTLGSSTAAGRVGSTIATGAARGALSGAVGGATGAGLSAALNNQDVISSALQGAKQGAGQGAFAGSVMSGANMAINKTPGVGKFLNDVNQAQQNWRESGDNFADRLTNTVENNDTWGNRFLANRAADVEAIGQGFKNVGEGLGVLAERGVNKVRNLVSKNTPAQLGESSVGSSGGVSGSIAPQNAQNVNRYVGVDSLGNRAEYSPAEMASLINDFDEYIKTPRTLSGNSSSEGYEIVGPAGDKLLTVYDTMMGGEGGNPIYNKNDWQKFQSWLDDQRTTLGTTGQQLAETPETEVYRTLAGGGNENPPTNTDLMYGESDLGNRTRRGMFADSLERLGNTLEGAQTNVTRAAANDLGIESTGKVIENVRKKTGITNMETQARLARELTGADNSLMDSVQRMALTASETGAPYEVDTSGLLKEIDSIVDKYADTNMFGSMANRQKFIDNLKTDISNLDSDVISIANRMKANAADLRGRGVAQATPADSAKARIYSEVANRLDDLSYKAIPQENIEALFDATISEMRGRANQAANNGNKDVANAYNKLAASLDEQPRTINAYRSFKKDFVDVSKINRLSMQAENGAAAQMGRSFGGGLKRLTGSLLQRPVNAALAKVGGAINSGADRISGDVTPTPTPTPTTTTTTTSTATNPTMNIYNAIGRTEGLTNAEQARTANYLTQATQNTTPSTLEDMIVPNTATQTTANNALYSSVYGANTPTTTTADTTTATPNAEIAQTGSVQGTSYFPTTGDYWTDVLAKAMTSAIDANDVTAFATLYNMYQDSLSKLESKNTSSTTSQQKLTATQQRANAAMNSLNRLSSMTPDLAYNLSNIPVIGGIATLGGNDYEAEAKSLAQQIGYMVSGANIKEEEAYNIGKAYVPQPWDNEQVRRNKLQRASEIIQQYQNAIAE